MRRADGLSCIAPAIHHEHRQIAAMAGGTEWSQMLFGMSWIVVTTSSKAGGRLALIHSGAAVAFLMNVKSMLARW